MRRGKKCLRKALGTILAVAVMFASMPTVPWGIEVYAENIAKSGTEDYTYKVLRDGTVEISKYTGRDTNIAVPEMIEGKKVTSIGNSAFSGCSNLSGIEIPNSVTSIGNSAFSSCHSLSRIKIPSSVTSIGYSAFENCSRLSRIEIPSSVTSIGSSVFSGCSSLSEINVSEKNIEYSSDSGVLFNKNKDMLICFPCGKNGEYKIPSSVTKIKFSAFRGCSRLSGIEIPSSVTSIEEFAFRGCSSLSRIEIPSSVTSIGEFTFSGCSSLSRIEIPNNVTSIGNSAFSDCSSLSGIEIPSSVTSIEKYTFSGCSSLSRIEIPNSVTSIGEFAFSGCSSLSRIEIPNSVTSIGKSVFYNCSRLSRIEIPSSVTSIKGFMFYNCSNLREIEIPSSVSNIGESAFYNCHNLSGIEIPSSVSNIGESAFYNCRSLSKIKIPSSVTSIRNYTFFECHSLSEIEISNSVTSIEYFAFFNCSNLSDIYYKGTEDDWNKIDMPKNIFPKGVIIHFMDSIVDSFELDSTAAMAAGSTSPIRGKLTLNKTAETSSAILSREVSDIKWTSSDQTIVSDSSISCVGVNSYDNRLAELMISFIPKKEGKVTITGTTSNGLTASCDITIGICITIDQKANDLEGCTIALSGTLTLEGTTETSEANLQAAIDSLKFESSDESKAKVLACNAVKSQDHRSAELEIWTTLYNKGTATITATAADGHTSKCEITIAEDTSESNTNYEGDYTSKMREFLLNKGTRNTLKYLCNDANFTASTFVAEKDAAVGNLLVMALTDVYYRGWDGWKDLIDGSTSVEEAEKIIASLLGAYQAEIEDLSKAKTAQKYAEMINDAFSDYSNASNLFKAMHSDEIEVVRKYFSESNIARLLYEGKYSEIAAPVNQILQDGKINQILQNGTQSEVFQQGSEAAKSWNKMMDGFTQSAEVSKVLKEGCQTKLGRLEIGGGLNGIGKALKVVSFAQDTINYLYQLESLLTADEMYCEMLLYIQENCAYSVVQEAAGNLYSIINDGVEGIISDVAIKAVNLGGEKVLDTALDIASKSCLPFTIVKAGFDWGVDLSNTFFKTGSTQELKDSLRSQAFLANCLGKWVVSNEIDYLSAIDTDNEMEKGKELYYSLYMLWESRKNAEETLQSLLKTTGADWSANYGVSTRITSALEAYQNNIFKDENMDNLLQISVSCPVDVEVYDKSGLKMLTIKDGEECQGYEKGIYYYCVYNPLADDYDKYIYYNEDADYNVKIIGNDLGLADCSVSRADDEGYISEFYFENMEIDNGTVINLDSISKEGVNYKITDLNGNETSNAMEHRKADKIATLSISLNTDFLELEVGEKQLLTVSFAPVNAANQKVVWDSSDDSVVSVNNDGVITAITAGTAVITVSQGDLKQICKITVKEQSGKIIFGDMNSDGEVNSKDAVLLKKHLAGYTGLNIDIIAADVNMDGNVDSKDAVRLLRHLAGYDVKLGK